MSALWTPVAPQGLALPPPCYRGVWLPGTSAQCRKSAVPLSLRLVSLAPRLPCLCSRGPFRTLCGSLGWMRGVSGSHLAGGLVDRGVPSTPEGMPPQCEARRWHSEARRTGRARCRLCVMCSNVPCGGAFGQKGGVPLHLASLDEPLSAPPLPRAIEGIAVRLARKRHPPCPHFARAPPWYTWLVLFLATITSAVTMGHDNTSVIECPTQICDSPLSSFLAASARAAEMPVCAATTWDVFWDVFTNVLTTLDKEITLDTTWNKWTRRTAMGREDFVRPSLAPRSPHRPCFRSATTAVIPCTYYSHAIPQIPGGSLWDPGSWSKSATVCSR